MTNGRNCSRKQKKTVRQSDNAQRCWIQNKRILSNKLLLLIGNDMSLAFGAHKLDFAEQTASCWGSVYVASGTSAPQHEGSPCGNTKHETQKEKNKKRGHEQPVV